MCGMGDQVIKTRKVAGGGGKMESRSDIKDKDKSNLRPKDVKNTKQ